MARIHYAVHGRGRGHATRSVTIVAALRGAGHEVHVQAGDDAQPFFADDEDAVNVVSLRPGMGLATMPALASRLAAHWRSQRSRRPDVVVSDGDMPSVLAASLSGISSVAVGHGLVFSHGTPPEGLPASPWRREARKARLASMTSTRQVAVSFVPMEARQPSATMARPVLRPELASAIREPGQRIICYFRDGNGAGVLGALVELGETPLLFAPCDPGVPGVQLAPPDAGAFAAALVTARAVVSSAGSQLISECAALGVPQFALYARYDDEQRLNVAMIRAAGTGDGASFEGFAKGHLETFLSSLDGRPAPENASWQAPNAAEAVVSAVEELASGRQAD